MIIFPIVLILSLLGLSFVISDDWEDALHAFSIILLALIAATCFAGTIYWIRS